MLANASLEQARISLEYILDTQIPAEVKPPAERLVPAPDCGMKYLTREIAFGKLQALSAGAALARRELT